MKVYGQKNIVAVEQPEQRNHWRYSVDESAVLLFAGNGMAQPGRIVDLSQEGCRLRTRDRLSVRARWPVEVSFNADGVAFRFSGVVEWATGGNLLGIRFVNMIPQRMVELARVICKMEATAAVRAEAVTRLVAEQEAPERAEREAEPLAGGQNREGARIEMSERGEAGPAAATIPAGPGPAIGPVLSRHDRRGNERHEIDTSAAILLVKVGSTLRGRILDLSLGGCRIRTDERFPVGIYTRVETEFRLEGLPFRLGGVIQAIHDRNTVGIRFLDLSERKRLQVAELIGEIEQMRKARVPVEISATGERV